MSRDYRDKPGGHTNKTMVTSSPTEFYKNCRRQARRQAKQALRQGIEPDPKYPIETEYWD